MKTNQLSNSLQLFLVFIILLSSNLCLGQWGIITEVKISDDPDKKKVKIQITPPKSKEITKEVQAGDTIYSGSTITIPRKTTLTITSVNDNGVAFRGQEKLIYTANTNFEDGRSIGENNDGSSLYSVSNEVNGDIRASNTENTVSLKTDATVFLVEVKGKAISYELISGKVTINRRINVRLNEEFIINSDEKREVFINEPLKLTKPNDRYSFNSDSLMVKTFNSEEDDQKFFKEQLRIQQRFLKKSGPLVRSAVKSLNNGQDSLGIKAIEESVSNGIIKQDFFIQSALLISEAYLENGKKAISYSWLEAALYFCDLELKESQELYDIYLKNGENDAAKAFGNDFAFANEYFAWGYTVKLKLTGCLETADQNPRKWRKDARDVRNKLNKL